MHRLSSLRLLLGACAALALAPVVPATAGVYTPYEIPGASTAATAACAPVMVYVSRGSSENSGTLSYYSGLGQEMNPVWYGLQALYGDSPSDPAGQPRVRLVTNRAPAPRAPGDGANKLGEVDPLGPGAARGYLGYRAVGVDYSFPAPAESIISTYEDSVADGVASAVYDIKKLHERCGSAKLIIIGYSEGAEVVRRALASPDMTWQPAAGTAFTMLFGDVLWKANEANVTFVGDTSNDQKGIIRRVREGFIGPASAAYVPAIPGFSANWNVNSWCHGGDIACQSPGGTLTAHLTYGEEDEVGAPMRAAAFAGGPFAAPVLTAKLSTPLACFTYGGSYRENLAIAGPAGASAEFVGTWEPNLGSAFTRTTLTVGGTAAANPPLSNIYLLTSLRFKVTWLGKKLDYRNRC